MGKTNDLLPGMEARPHRDGKTVTYRYHPPGRKPMNLGTDKTEATQAVRRMRGLLPPLDALAPAAISEMLKRQRKGAAQRGIYFSLSDEDVLLVLRAQGNRCAVTKLPFSEGKPPGHRIRPWMPSLDRSDVDRGYTLSNVRVVCAFVDVAMNGFGEAMFRQVLEPLVEQAVQERLAALSIPVGIAVGKTPYERP